MSDTGNAILIVAAGRGTRFGDPRPKQYVPIAGRCSLRRCLDTFLSMARIGRVQVVIHENDTAEYQQAVAHIADTRLMPAMSGGNTRAASVFNGLVALQPFHPGKVLVHDAARPFVTPPIVTDVLDALDHSDCAFAAIPVVDALWKAQDGQVSTSVPRDNLWRAQTPQGFRFDRLLGAHQKYDGDAADDVEIARAAGMAVSVVRGDAANFKVTSPEDLARAEAYLRGQSQA